MTILIPEWFLYVLTAWIAVEVVVRIVNIYRACRNMWAEMRFKQWLVEPF